MAFKKGHPHYTTKGDFQKGHTPWNKNISKWIDCICLNCNVSFKIRKLQFERGRGKYCSINCKNDYMKGSIHLNIRKRLIKVCQQCGELFEIRHCENHRKHCSRKCSNLNNLMKPKWGKYKGINMRSNWEIKYAKYLDKNKIKWLYESQTFDLGDSAYTPDFYLPETNEYIEIKGYLTDKCKNKLNKFKEMYSNTNFAILQGRELNNLGIKIAERFIYE